MGADTLQIVVEHLGRAIEPLSEGFSSLEGFERLMLQLGWEVTSIPDSYVAVGGEATGLLQDLEALTDGATVAEVVDILERVHAIYAAVDAIEEVPGGVDPGLFFEQLTKNLFDLLLIDYLLRELPALHDTLELLGVIDKPYVEATATRPAFVRYDLHFEKLGDAILDPVSVPAQVLDWGGDSFQLGRLLDILVELFTALNVAVTLLEPELEDALAWHRDGDGPLQTGGILLDFFEVELLEEVETIGLQIHGLPGDEQSPSGLILVPQLPSELSAEVEITDALSFEVRAGTDLAQAFAIVLKPNAFDFRHPFEEGAAVPNVGVGVALRHHPDTPTVLLGSPGGTRLEVGDVTLELSLDHGKEGVDFGFGFDVTGLQVVIVPKQIDPFLTALGGEDEISLSFPIRFAWSHRYGVDFVIGGGIEATLHPHLELGPLTIPEISVALRVVAGSEQPFGLKARVGTAIEGELGPVAFTMRGIGLGLDLTLAPDGGGPVGLTFGAVGPTGVGVRVEAGPITGAGFLDIDADKGRYVGMLQLDLSGIGITAIGIIDTKLPTGEDGFAMVVSISVTFAPALQLGLGFTLNGLGGLVAINRTLSPEGLQKAIRSGSLDHVLFPEDPVAQASTIIQSLDTIFPPKADRYVFGPMALFGWGTPTLFELRAGIVLQIPDLIIAVLGTGRLALPTKEAPVIQLNFDIAGIIDFSAKLFSFDASLYDSFVAIFSIEGDLALRIGWGNNAQFVLSVGGFHPRFPLPPGIPEMRRLALSLGVGSNPRIRIEGYFAITTNSVQFGASAEITIGNKDFGVFGWLKLDVLIIFSPFSFAFDFAAGVQIKAFGINLLGIWIEGSISGPTPFYISGRATLSILFFDVSVSFSASFGDPEKVELEKKDPWPELLAALENVQNWNAPTKRDGFGITVRIPDGVKDPLVDPSGRVSFTQKVLPFNRTLEKFGEFRPDGITRFDLTDVLLGGTALDDFEIVEGEFVPGHFTELTEDERLTRPAFESMDAGAHLGAAASAIDFGSGQTVDVKYETLIVDEPRKKPRFGEPYILDSQAQLRLDGRSASVLSQTLQPPGTRFAPSGVNAGATLLDERWVVVSLNDLTEQLEAGRVMSRGQAQAVLDDHLRSNPQDRGRLGLMPGSQVDDP